jgi:hypothetical protein
VSALEGQSGALNKTSVESAVQEDDFREVKRRKRHICNDTSETAKKSTKPVPTTAAVKLPQKAVLTRDTDSETIGAEKTLPEQGTPRKLGRQPPVVMTLPQTSFDSKAT